MGSVLSLALILGLGLVALVVSVNPLGIDRAGAPPAGAIGVRLESGPPDVGEGQLPDFDEGRGPFLASEGTTTLRLSEAQLAWWLMGRYGWGKVAVRCGEGQIGLRASNGGLSSLEGWLFTAEDRARFQVRSASWRGFPVPGIVVLLAERYLNQELQHWQKSLRIADLRVNDGELVVTIQPR